MRTTCLKPNSLTNKHKLLFAMTSTPDHIQLKVQISRLDLLFKQSLPTILVSLVVVSLAAFGLKDRVASDVLSLWLGSVVGLSVIRALFLIAYILIKPEGVTILKWERPYFITLMAPVAAWGIGGAWAAHDAEAASRFLILFFLFGMAGGAQGAYSSVRYILLSCVYTLLLPITILMLLSGSRIELYAALGSLLYAVMVLRNSALIHDAMSDARSLQFQLADEKSKVERLAMYDFLTGLHNRRAFEELAGATLKASRFQQRQCQLLMIDVDHFKSVNDRYGHATGDIVLKRVAATLNKLIRETDLSARFGGEEFIVFLPNAKRTTAVETAERIRKSIEQLDIKSEGESIRVTISIGVSGDSYDLNQLLGEADRALYQSKRDGRNRVTIAD